MKCMECEHFKMASRPCKPDCGTALCEKHDLVKDFTDIRQLRLLNCVEESMEDGKIVLAKP